MAGSAGWRPSGAWYSLGPEVVCSQASVVQAQVDRSVPAVGLQYLRREESASVWV